MLRLILLLALIVPFSVSAQFTTGSALTVFSESGDKFYLILNGERQNDVAQTNVRIEELPQPYYNAVIIFEDKSLPEIRKTALPVTDGGTGAQADVTYRIRKDKSGKPKLTYYSAIPVAQDFVPPSGMFVRRFGTPMPPSIGAGAARTTTTTTTTTVGANVNMGGMGVNISITEPAVSITETTTTTTRGGGMDNYSHDAGGCDGWAMDAASFRDAKQSISQSSFEETKLTTAKSIADNNCLSSDQVAAICRLFSFETSKLDFAKHAYRHTIDPGNYFKVNNVFSFDASRQELSQFVGH